MEQKVKDTNSTWQQSKEQFLQRAHMNLAYRVEELSLLLKRSDFFAEELDILKQQKSNVTELGPEEVIPDILRAISKTQETYLETENQIGKTFKVIAQLEEEVQAYRKDSDEEKTEAEVKLARAFDSVAKLGQEWKAPQRAEKIGPKIRIADIPSFGFGEARARAANHGSDEKESCTESWERRVRKLLEELRTCRFEELIRILGSESRSSTPSFEFGGAWARAETDGSDEKESLWERRMRELLAEPGKFTLPASGFGELIRILGLESRSERRKVCRVLSLVGLGQEQRQMAATSMGADGVDISELIRILGSERRKVCRVLSLVGLGKEQRQKKSYKEK